MIAGNYLYDKVVWKVFMGGTLGEVFDLVRHFFMSFYFLSMLEISRHPV